MRNEPRGQLQAILLNMIVNAIEAMDDNMRTRAAPEIGRRELYTVMDTGPGIDPKNWTAYSMR